MPRGDKDKYTDKQKRKAGHIEESYEKRGVSEEEAERRAWATVNAMHHGGEKPGGGGYGKPENKEPARKGGRKGGSHWLISASANDAKCKPEATPRWRSLTFRAFGASGFEAAV
jgi:plasmid stabilization system protein ParE